MSINRNSLWGCCSTLEACAFPHPGPALGAPQGFPRAATSKLLCLHTDASTAFSVLRYGC